MQVLHININQKNLSIFTEQKPEDAFDDFMILHHEEFSNQNINIDEVIEALVKQPSVLQRESISTRITEKIKDFVKTFINGVDN